MMKRIIQWSYSLLIFPLILSVVGIISIIDRKYRRALLQRFKTLHLIKEFLDTTEIPESNNRIIIHCASMGEFEHIKPLIQQLHKAGNNTVIITFFSPSGYEHVKSFPGVAFIVYQPLDFAGTWRKFYQLIKPSLLIISKHDAWPNQVWVAQEQQIPTFLVNASLSANSSRAGLVARKFFRLIYESFTGIYAISQRDAQRFESLLKIKNVIPVGDTKFDQVINRKNQSQNVQIIDERWLQNDLILLLGSVWAEDLIHLNEAVNSLLQHYPDLKVIIVPHQPQEGLINHLKNYFQPMGVALFSENHYPASSRVLIIDKVGILADCYKYAHIAYVGGSFKQGIHNVMEPAVYGLPVLFGPRHQNSFEAIQLNQLGGGITVHNTDEAFRNLSALVNDEKFRQKTGNHALTFALENSGAVDKLLKYWEIYLKSN
jgi:3-deoxy-D-manno-octulosonic-acid transferase